MIEFQDLGVIDYQEAWDYQEKCFNGLIDAKLEMRKNPDLPYDAKNFLLFCEHPHVYTLGKSGEMNNLLINESFMAQKGAKFYKINRGGDITYHGPGQIVGYPIFDLEHLKLQVKSYIYLLEEAIINTLADLNIKAERLEGSTGVWLDVGIAGKTRKICAIGVKASRYVTMHGFALNVNTDLNYFSYINPCGFVDKGVTSIEKELGTKQDFEAIKQLLKSHLAKVFGVEFV